MINDFEQRLAFVLGLRLAAPLTGQVFAPPAPAVGAAPSFVVGVTAVRPAEGSFLTRKPEVVPGSPDPRRILRLECDVSIEARAGQNQARDAQVQALDAVLYALGTDDFQSGAALTDATDRGFFIQDMQFSQGTLPVSPGAQGAPPVGITLVARGYFWPVGQAGQTGAAIERIELRGAKLDIDLDVAAAQLIAGGPPVNVSLRVRPAGSLEITAAGAAAAPIGSLAVTLSPGRGTLGGGVAGATGGIRIVPLVNDAAAVTYTPPAQTVEEELVVAFDNHEGGLAGEIGRFALRVRGA